MKLTFFVEVCEPLLWSSPIRWLLQATGMLFAIENPRLTMNNGYNGRRQKTSSPQSDKVRADVGVESCAEAGCKLLLNSFFFSWMIFLPGKWPKRRPQITKCWFGDFPSCFTRENKLNKVKSKKPPKDSHYIKHSESNMSLEKWWLED